MVAPPAAAGGWRVDVRFVERGVLCAEARGVLDLMPEDALQIITHPAGDELFRVAARQPVEAAATDGARGDGGDGAAAASSSTIVDNRAPVRVLAYKFWAVSRVLFTVSHAKPPPLASPPPPLGGRKWAAAAVAPACSVRALRPGRAGSTVTFSLISSNMLKELSGSWQLEPLLAAGGEQVAGTRMAYRHDVRPKGLPRGVQYVPGMGSAVRASVAKEVHHMLEKASYVADKVSRGLPVVAALEQTVDELRAAGGSFKKLQQSRAKVAAARPAVLELKSIPLTLDFELIDGAEGM